MGGWVGQLESGPRLLLLVLLLLLASKLCAVGAAKREGRMLLLLTSNMCAVGQNSAQLESSLPCPVISATTCALHTPGGTSNPNPGGTRAL